MSKNKTQYDKQREIWNDEAKFISVFTYSKTEQKWKESKRQHREFSSIILPVDQKDKIMNDIDKFRKSEHLYRKHNIPYRRGYCYYGPPGTGKTSIAIATATICRRPIYFIPSDLNIDALTSIPHNVIVLFEDIDKSIMTNDTKYREVDSEPIPDNTAYPTINPDEHNIWLRAIKANENIVSDYKNDYSGLEANFDISVNNGVSLMDSVAEGVLTDMKKGFAEPRAAIMRKVEGQDYDNIETTPAETEEDFKTRRTMYKNIIREVNRLRQEHYDATRFDQEKIGLLLQLIDGALTPYGSIFIMTTNHKNNIHTAMLRAGRMDVINEINYMSGDSVDTMLDKFNIPHDKRDAIINKVRIPGRANNITAAELQGAILEIL
jgi:SpoVK/Ycf46/Vps4 family AAA+-type ATPase